MQALERSGWRANSPETAKGEAEEPGRGADREDALCCARCGRLIALSAAGITVEGIHVHTCANPHGIVYRFACFREAPGVAGVGQRSGDFAWFAGFEWQVAVCRRCLLHLGWIFQGKTACFFGLILDNLVGSTPSGTA